MLIYLHFVRIHSKDAGRWFLAALVRSPMTDKELGLIFKRVGIDSATAQQLLEQAEHRDAGDVMGQLD